MNTGGIVQHTDSTATILSAILWSIIVGDGLPILLWIFCASSKRHIFYTSSSSPTSCRTILSLLPLPYTLTHGILPLCSSSTPTTNNTKAALSFLYWYLSHLLNILTVTVNCLCYIMCVYVPLNYTEVVSERERHTHRTLMRLLTQNIYYGFGIHMWGWGVHLGNPSPM